MGTWGPGPFDSDAAADFLVAVATSPSRFVTRALRAVAGTPSATYLDVDDGGAGWAACELVALAFGHGESASRQDRLLAIAAALKPKEAQRLLALEVVTRIADRATSELAALRHEGEDGPAFDAALLQLRGRLEAAAEGARPVAKPRAGDVMALPPAPEAAGWVVVQVVGAGEVAVFEGHVHRRRLGARLREAPTCASRARIGHRAARSRQGARERARSQGPEGQKLYADDNVGSFIHYAVSTASGGGLQIVSEDEARDLDLRRVHDEPAIRAVALGTLPVRRVRSVDEREAELRERHAAEWVLRRQVTTPGPFGDPEQLRALVEWMEQYGVENAIRQSHAVAVGSTGYGRPNRRSERGFYAFAGLVALWRGTWLLDVWPPALAGRLPRPPSKKLMTMALEARALAERVITRDAELRLIWEGAPDGGAELRSVVASLRAALS